MPQPLGRAHSPRRRVFLQLEELEPRHLLSATFLEALIAEPLVSFAPQAYNATVVGLQPVQVRKAYGIDRVRFNGGLVAGDGLGQTIAIVAAFDHPTIASDLRTFSRTFGLPDPPSFVKAMPQGQPPSQPQWALEIALDVQWAHAIAPKANILLVEAKSDRLADLLPAVEYASRQPGVVVVSMSWGASEFAGETYYDRTFTTPAGHVGGAGLPGGVSFVAASGDYGAGGGPLWPAISPNVLAVGGTRLILTASSSYSRETAWTGSGGGVSRYEPQPSYQTGFQVSPKRTNPDVSYNGDTATGFAVYCSVPVSGKTGWFRVAGTSAGAPQWAALLAIAAQGRALLRRGAFGDAPAALYALPAGDFYDVTAGSNGYPAGPGYDLATGRGSPRADILIGHLLTLSVSTSRAGSLSTTFGVSGSGQLAAAVDDTGFRIDVAAYLSESFPRTEGTSTTGRAEEPSATRPAVAALAPPGTVEGGPAQGIDLWALAWFGEAAAADDEVSQLFLRCWRDACTPTTGHPWA